MGDPTNTPLVKQYLEIKKDYTDVLVFFRLGDFYELFFEDAIIASKLLQITLTRKGGNNAIPMCGVPHHAILPYLKKLIEKGHKVAIAEQVSPPGKGLVERKVVQVITPGQVIDYAILNQKENNFLGAIYLSEFGYYLAYLDLSTGEAYIKESLDYNMLITSLKNLAIKEVIIPFKYDNKLLNDLKTNNILVNFYDNLELKNNKIITSLSNQDCKKVGSLLLNFLDQSQKMSLVHILNFEVIKPSDILTLDYEFFNHLEIFRSNFDNNDFTLFSVLDNTQTAAGARLLKKEMLNPIKNITILNKRYDIISSFYSPNLIEGLKQELSKTYDITRIISRLVANKSLPRDLLWLKDTIAIIPQIKCLLNDIDNPSIKEFNHALIYNKDLFNLLDKAINNPPVATLSDGGIFKNGYNIELDKMRKIADGNSDFILNYEQNEKERLNIKNLKIATNSVFGYYIEISKVCLRDLDENLIKDYERKQTLANCERFTTKVLKEYEKEIFNLTDKIISLEQKLYKDLIDLILTKLDYIQNLASILAQLDFYLSLTITALTNNYTRAELISSRDLELLEARHPVVEKHTKIISNDCKLTKGAISLITGPNMGGKSTYMRTCALIIYLAHIGSFVPCRKARIPIYDHLYTRIGASDNIAAGMSTFMLEMSETKKAITEANERSLLFFDEIGRGTATYDGIALACAIINYVNKIGAQMLFATHYHELVDLTKELSNISNIHAHANKENNKMIFSYKMLPGAISKSYGIEVADLAGLPKELISDAKKILAQIGNNIKFSENVPPQNDLFSSNINENIDSEIVNELKQIDINLMSPLDAINYLANLKKRYQND